MLRHINQDKKAQVSPYNLFLSGISEKIRSRMVPVVRAQTAHRTNS